MTARDANLITKRVLKLANKISNTLEKSEEVMKKVKEIDIEIYQDRLKAVNKRKYRKAKAISSRVAELLKIRRAIESMKVLIKKQVDHLDVEYESSDADELEKS